MAGKLDYVEQFIRDVQANLSDGMPEELNGLLISRWGQGSLILDGNDAAAYRAAADRLNADFNKGEDLSRRSVEKSLEEALFHALDLQGGSSVTFEERLREGLKILAAQLGSNSIEYRVLVQIEGLSPKDLPFALGSTHFVKFDSRQRGPMLRGQSRSYRETLIRTAERLDEKVCAQVSIAARDFDAARFLARRKARTTIDCINFFADLVPYNHGWLYFPWEAAPTGETTVARDSDGRDHVGLDAQGPALPFSVEHLRESRSLFGDFRRLGRLCDAAKPKTAAGCLRTAFEWAGRATVEPKREEGYLLFAIALESAVLPTEHPELNYRLSRRVSALLTQNRQRRSELRSQVGRLYGIRSRVAHSAFSEVSEQDLGALRLLTKRTLIRLLRAPRIWPMSLQDYDSWLESQSER
jgi:hypothetical protein